MGGSYYVPRSVKGESRILFIFTVKSFLLTIAFGMIGVLIWMIGGQMGLPMIAGIISVVISGGIGFAIGAITIPDSPAMGPLRKAGGENLFDILMRILTFRGKKKIYIYDYKREKGGVK